MVKLLSRSLVFGLVFLLASSLASCRGNNNSSISGVKVTAPTFPSPYRFKTSNPGMATVAGTLVVINPLTTAPAPNDSIYLVTVDQSQGGLVMPEIETGNSIQADVNEQTGDFVFINVKPGSYIIMVKTLAGAEMPVHKMHENTLGVVTVTDADKDKIVPAGILSLP
jgi:hypothetical protein